MGNEELASAIRILYSNISTLNVSIQNLTRKIDKLIEVQLDKRE